MSIFNSYLSPIVSSYPLIPITDNKRETAVSQQLPLLPLQVLLREKGVIDAQGKISCELPSFPILELDQIIEIDRALNQQVIVKAGQKEAHISLKNTLLYVYYKYPQLIPQIEIVGGFVRKILLSSPFYVCRVLTTLTGLSAEEVKPYTDQIVAEAKKRQLPDIDIRVQSSDNQKNTLAFFTNAIVEYFAIKFQCPLPEAKQTAFTKFHLIHNDENQFSIATVRPQNFPDFELLFIGSLSRRHLFSHDSIRLSILPYLLGEGPIAIESDYATPWLPLTDLITKTVRVEQPDAVDVFGFPIFMSFLTRGHKAADIKDIARLSAKVTQLSQYHEGIPDQIAGYLKTTAGNHFSGNPTAVMGLTLNACLHLQLSANEYDEIWTRMRAEHWHDADFTHAELLKLIDKAFSEHKVPLNILMAALTLFWADQGPLTPILGTPYFFSSPLDPLTAAHLLSEYLKETSELSGLSALIAQGKTARKAASNDHFTAMAQELLKSKQRTQRFLGFSLLAKFGTSASIPQLLTHFLDAFNTLPQLERKAFIDSLESTIFPICLLEQFKHSHFTDQTESRQLVSWIELLSKNTSYVLTAKDLWTKYRHKFPMKICRKMDQTVIAALLPEHLEQALKLFEIGQDPAAPRTAKQELEQLTIFFPYMHSLADARFHIVRLTFDQLLSYALSDIPDTLSDKSYVETFTSPFAKYIDKLLKTGNHEQAHRLLQLALSHPLLKKTDPHLFRCHLNYMNVEGIANVGIEWSKLEVRGPCPAPLLPLYQQVHLKAIQSLFANKKDREKGFKELRLYAHASPPDPQLYPYILKHLSALSAAQADTEAVKLIDTLYRAHLPQDILQAQQRRLFDNYLHRGELNEAYKIWTAIKTAYPETANLLLDRLTGTHPKLSLRILKSEVDGSMLSFDEKAKYFLNIYAVTQAPEILAFLLEHSFDTRLSSTEQMRAFAFLIQELPDCDAKKTPKLLKIAQEKSGDIFNILDTAGRFEQIDQFAQALEKNTSLPITSSFCDRQFHHWFVCGSYAKALIWLQRTDQRREESPEWLEEILRLYQNIPLEYEVEALLAFRCQAAVFFAARAAKLFLRPDLSCTSLELLLAAFTPQDPAIWKALIAFRPDAEFSFIWQSFYKWLQTCTASDRPARRVALQALDRLQACEPSLLPRLLSTLDSPDSPLGRLCTSPVETLEMKSKLILPLAKSEANVGKIAALLSPLEKNVTAESISIYRDLILELTTHCLEKNTSQFSEYACTIFTALSFELANYKGAYSTDRVAGTMIALLSQLQSSKHKNRSKQILALTEVCAKWRHQAPQSLPALKIAKEMSKLEDDSAVYETFQLLSLTSKPSPLQDALWGYILPRLLELALKPEKAGCSDLDFFTLYNAHKDKLVRGSREFYRCSDSCFDYSLGLLDNWEDLADFDSILIEHFKWSINDEKAYSLNFEIGSFPYLFPLFEFGESANTGSKKLFFNRLSSLISKALDTPIRETALEEFALKFITNNLKALCQAFPENRKTLVFLLDKYYYRYPPEETRFYYNHLSTAIQLLNLAHNKQIYDDDLKKLNEAMLVLDVKLIVYQGEDEREQIGTVERAINRLVATRTPLAVVRAVYIIQLCQRESLTTNFNIIKGLYEKLIEAAMLDPFYLHRKCTLFEWIRLSITSEYTKPVSLGALETGKSTATALHEMLFNAIYHLSQTPEKLRDPPEITQGYLLQWLTKLLISARESRGFEDQKGPERYFRLIEKLVKPISKSYPSMNNQLKGEMLQLLTRAIIGEKFQRTTKFPNSIKKIRAAAMRDWLVSLADERENCAAALVVACKEGVFDAFPKDKKRVIDAISQAGALT